MSASTPQISVVMSVYNGADYLSASVESILQQTYADFEFIIIDDGSTDASWDILQTYAQTDQRIRLFQNESNLGLTKSLNKGMHLARGEYIARQDADDLALAHRFARQIAVFHDYPDVVLVSCDLELIDTQGRLLPHKIQRSCDPDLIPWHLVFCNYLGGHSQVMFRHQAAIDLGGYCETYRYAQDYEFWCRLATQGGVVILPDVLQRQRMHDASVSAQKKTEQDQFSLTQSQRNMAELLAEDLSLEAVNDLRGLMMIPAYWYYFPDLRLSHQRTAALHRNLQKLYQAFRSRRLSTPSDPTQVNLVSRKLQRLISQQFLCWMQHLGLRKNLWLKLQVLTYAYRWSPIHTIRTAWKKP